MDAMDIHTDDDKGGSQQSEERGLNNLDSRGDGITFLNELAESLRDKAVSHPLLEDFATLSIDEIRLFTEQFSLFVDAFPRLVGGVIFSVRDPLIRQILVDNLVDECGGIEAVESTDIQKSHPELYKKFMRALKISQKEIEEVRPLPSTKAFIAEYETLALSSPLISLGAFGPGNECLSNKWIPVVDALREKGFSNAELEFFIIHLPADEKHGSALIRTLAPYVEDKEARTNVEQGANRAVAARLTFYDGVYSEILKNRESGS